MNARLTTSPENTRADRPKNQSGHRREPLFNNVFQEKLNVLALQSLQHAAPEDRAPGSKTNLGQIPPDSADGVTHINFGPSAKSQLGQLLSFANPLRFYHPGLDIEIPSMQHLWVFLQEGATNRNIFKLSNDRLRAFMRTAGSGKYIPNQFALIAQAYWYKFQEHQLLGDLFADVNVLFDYYLSDARGRRRPMSASHLVDILKVLKQALRQGLQPDLTPFMDRDVQIELKSLQIYARLDRIDEILNDAIVKHLKAQQDPRPAVKAKTEQGVQNEPSATSMGLTYPEEVQQAEVALETVAGEEPVEEAPSAVESEGNVVVMNAFVPSTAVNVN